MTTTSESKKGKGNKVARVGALDFLRNLSGESINGSSSVPSTIDINLIDPDPDQPRDTFFPVDGIVDPYSLESLQELADSIEAEGLHQEPTVRIHPTIPGRYMIVMGERRWRACKLLAEAGNKAFEKIPTKISSASGANLVIAQLTENLQREDLTDLQVAHTVQRMLKEYPELQKKELGKIMKKNSQYISRILALVDPRWAHVVDAGFITYASLLDQFKALPEKAQNNLVQLAQTENRPLTVTDIRAAKKESVLEEKELSEQASVGSLQNSTSEQSESSDNSGNDTGANFDAPGSDDMGTAVQQFLESAKGDESYEYTGPRRDRIAPTVSIPDRGQDAELPVRPVNVSVESFSKLPLKLTIEQLAIIVEQSLLPANTIVETNIDVETVRAIIGALGGELPGDSNMLVSSLIKTINKVGK